MKTEQEITELQGQIINAMINSDDEKTTLFYKGQIRILSWVLSQELERQEEVPVSESKEEEDTGGVK